VKIGGKLVNLSNIRLPLLNIYAEQDHLVPPPSSIALGQYIGSSDYTLRSFPVGHIGMYVSGKVQRGLPPLIAQWVKERGYSSRSTITASASPPPIQSLASPRRLPFASTALQRAVRLRAAA